MDTRAFTDDEMLAWLRTEFTGHRIWRSVRWDGRLGDWVATLHDPMAGVDPTIIRNTAASLREALVQDRDQAAARPRRMP
ncbi:hypothetical protein ACFVH6_06595 [Spirillospora sp. NPDC127200]